MGRVSRRMFATAGLAALATVPRASAAPRPRAVPAVETGEMRGMWVATVTNRDWPSRPGLSAARQRAELLAHLDAAVRDRLNTVVFQVRPTADALWPSPYEPWSRYLTGTQGGHPGWDPLGTARSHGCLRWVHFHVEQ